MRAFRLTRNGGMLDTRAQAPQPANGEALVRPTRVLVVAADTPAPGEFTENRVPGSHFVGLVESLALDASTHDKTQWVGRRVVASPILACAECDLCLRGLGEHCRTRRFIGRDIDGCFAEAMTLPLRNLVEVPDSVEDDVAVFANLVAVALRAVAQVRPSTLVTIVGDDALALICAQFVAAQGERGRLLGFRPSRYLLCEKWGVKHRHGGEPGRRQDQDAVIDCVGSPESTALALGLIRPRGTLIIAAGPRAPFLTIVRDELTVVGVSTGSVNEAVSSLSRGLADVSSLITRRFSLDHADEALRAAADPDHVAIVMDV